MSSKNAFINKLAAFLPNAPVSNDQMEGILGQTGDRPSRARKLILRSNKITSRHYAIDPSTGKSNYTNAQLAAEAIRGLINEKTPLDDVELLACSTTIPDQIIPNHAVMVHGELGAPTLEAVSTAGVCVCGVTALRYAYLGIKAGEVKHAVACASEAVSSSLRSDQFFNENDDQIENLKRNPEVEFEKDFLRWMLSDGAGAAWLSDSPTENGISLRVEWIDVLSYAHEMSTCMYAGAVKNDDGSLTGWKTIPQTNSSESASCMTITQDVKQLNEHILTYTIEKPLTQIAKKRNLNPEQYDYFLPHFSSGYFEDRVADSLERINFSIPKSKWFTNLFSKGNTGSASIYIILEELFNSGKLKSGEKILCHIPESGRFTAAFMQLTVV